MFLSFSPPTSSLASTSDQEDREYEEGNGGSGQYELTALDRAMFYAGEAVSLHNRGTAHGAYKVGQRTAMDVIAAMKVDPATALSTTAVTVATTTLETNATSSADATDSL